MKKVLGLMLMLSPALVYADTYVYEFTPGTPIDGSSPCGSPAVVNLPVTDSFSVNNITVGFNASHPWRGDIRADLISPGGAVTVRIIPEETSGFGPDENNYDLELDSSSSNPLDDGNNDNVNPPYYDLDRVAAPPESLTAFNVLGEALGTWTLEICDEYPAADNGTLNRIRLTFDGTPNELPPSITKSLVPSSIAIGDNTTVTYTVTNNATVGLTGVSFSESIDPDVSLANTSIGGTCSGFGLGGASVGDTSWTLSGGTLAIGESCTVSLTLTGSAVGSYPSATTGVNSNETSPGLPSNSGVLTVTLIPAGTISKTFSSSFIEAGDTTSVTYTLSNPNAVPLTGTTFSETISNAVWLDSTSIGGSCTGFTLAGGTSAGDVSWTLQNGTIPANSSCTVSLTLMSASPGSFTSATGNLVTNEAGVGGTSNSATLTVTESGEVACVPGDQNSGAVFAFSNGTGNGLYSVDLLTAKAYQFDTVGAGTQNSMAVNRENYLIYYSDNPSTSSNVTVYYYDLRTGTSSVLIPDVTALGINISGSGVGSAGASYANNVLYLGLENGGTGGSDEIYRIILNEDGRSARYAYELYEQGGGNDFGDLIAANDKLLTVNRGATTDLRILDLDTLTQTTLPSDLGQGGAQREGTTIWGVGSTLRPYDYVTGTFLAPARQITTDGTTPWAEPPDAGSCVVATSSVGDFVFNDNDADGVVDPGELGIAGVTLDLYIDINNDGVLTAADDVDGNGVLNENDRRDRVVSASDGSYRFDNVLPGNWVIRVSDVNNVLGGAASTTGGNDRAVADMVFFDQRTNEDFGYQAFIVVQGAVFDDDGSGGGIAHDGLQQAGEEGLDSLEVELIRVADDSLLAATLTRADGSYRLQIPNSFAGESIRVRTRTLSDYVSVSESAGTTGGTPGAADDVLEFVPAAGTVYTGVNFGDVARNTFLPDRSGTLAAGQVAFYAHRFRAGTLGNLVFTSSAQAVPAGIDWQHVLFQDSNCDGQLQSVEAAVPLPAVIAVVADEEVCIINKVFAPTDLSPGARYTVDIQAQFEYLNETPDGLLDTAVVKDVSLSTQLGLLLEKTVENLTQGTGVSISNTARPGDVLRYTLIFSNVSSQPLSDLSLYDRTPAFTTLSAPVSCPAVLPDNLVGCTVVTPAGGANVPGYDGPVRWQFDPTDTLAPGASGQVQFEVEVE